MSHDIVVTLPVGEICVYLPANYDDVVRIVGDIKNRTDVHFLGFDTESTVVQGRSHNPVSLVQLATDTECWLFQVEQLRTPPGNFPKALADLLGNPQHIKVGAAAEGDADRLADSFPGEVRCRGVLDLQHLERSRGGAGSHSLSKLAERYVGRMSTGGPGWRGTDWDGVLDYSMIQYAVADAVYSFLIYQKMLGAGPAESVEASAQEIEIDTQALRTFCIARNGHGVPVRPPSLVNQIVNSFAPWRNTLAERDRRRLATAFVDEAVADGFLQAAGPDRVQVAGQATAPLPDYDPADDGAILTFFTPFLKDGARREDGLVNQIANSYAHWVRLGHTLDQRRHLARTFVERAVVCGTLHRPGPEFIQLAANRSSPYLE